MVEMFNWSVKENQDSWRDAEAAWNRDDITIAELWILLEFYTQLYSMLTLLGDEWTLVRDPILVEWTPARDPILVKLSKILVKKIVEDTCNYGSTN